MDGLAFDALVRSMARPDTRRRLLQLLTGLPLAGWLTMRGDEASTLAQGRRGRRHQAQHQHRHAQTERRKEQREAARSEACIPTGQRCPAKKPRGKHAKKLSCSACCQGSFTTDATGKKVCGCQPNGGACTTTRASSCCSGFCNRSTCQAAPCSAASPCPQCQTCNGTTGLCEAVTNGTNCDDGNPCTTGDTCQSGICQSGSAVVCPSGQRCVGGSCVCDATSCPTGCCDGTTCIASDSQSNQVCGIGGATCANCLANNSLCESGACQGCDVICTGTPSVCGAALQAAIAVGGTHYVCPGTYQPPSTLGFLPPLAGVTLIGAGDGADPAINTVLDGNNAGRVLTVNNLVGTVVLERLRFTRGRLDNGGGIMHLGTTVQMSDCTVTGNTSTDGSIAQGGGINNSLSRVLEMTRCTVSDNHAPDGLGNGGGLVANGPTTLTDCLVSGNTAANIGGGIFVNGGSLTLNTTLVGGTTPPGAPNTATNGGGIFLNTGTVTLNAGNVVCGNVPNQCVGFSDPAHCLAMCPP